LIGKQVPTCKKKKRMKEKSTCCYKKEQDIPGSRPFGAVAQIA
jgi:hypothetical protein